MTQATRATLYLGADISKPATDYLSFRGDSVTVQDFSVFLDDYVTPVFPGFTVRDTVGYWKGKPERSRELVILAEDGASPAFHSNVESIARAYKRKFRQESVMISYEPVTVQFDVPDLLAPAPEPACQVGYAGGMP